MSAGAIEPAETVKTVTARMYGPIMVDGACTCAPGKARPDPFAFAKGGPDSDAATTCRWCRGRLCRGCKRRGPDNETTRLCDTCARSPFDVLDDWEWALPGNPPSPGAVGKWMLWPSIPAAHDTWLAVKAATEAGRLGVQAKVSTLPSRNSPDSHLICVYTRDLNDHDDVIRVLGALRDMGFDEHLSYRSDEDTRSTIPGAIYVSTPRSRRFEDRRGTRGRSGGPDDHVRATGESLR